jgi:hypothetical protein
MIGNGYPAVAVAPAYLPAGAYLKPPGRVAT